MLIPAEIWTVAKAPDGNAVLIRPTGSKSVVPIFVDPSVAHSIVIGIGEVSIPRPLTHDIFVSTLKQLDTEITRIEITAINDNVFYARLILIQSESEEFIVDARPSDCIAVAVRVKCPIFIDEEVVDQAGMPISAVTGLDGDSSNSEHELKQPSNDSRLGQLKKDLSFAIDEEDYEEAAKIRDIIKDMEDN